MKSLIAVVALVLAGCSAATHAAPTPVPSGTIASIVTQPDVGTTGGYSIRWAGPTVTYRFDGEWPDDYLRIARDAFSFAADATGLSVVETDGTADITVLPKSDNGAYAQMWPNSNGTIKRATVELGCCRPRAAWEDILQAFGIPGDSGPDGTLFSNDPTATVAGPFEACVLRELYAHPPHSPAAAFDGVVCP